MEIWSGLATLLKRKQPEHFSNSVWTSYQANFPRAISAHSVISPYFIWLLFWGTNCPSKICMTYGEYRIHWWSDSLASHTLSSVLTCVFYSHVWSAGSGYDWGRERGGPAVPVYFPADRGGREYWGATGRWGECEYGGVGRELAMPVVTVVTAISRRFYVGVINTTPDFLFILVSCSKWRSQPMNSKMSWTWWCLNVRIFWMIITLNVCGFSI